MAAGQDADQRLLDDDGFLPENDAADAHAEPLLAVPQWIQWLLRGAGLRTSAT